MAPATTTRMASSKRPRAPSLLAASPSFPTLVLPPNKRANLGTASRGVGHPASSSSGAVDPAGEDQEESEASLSSQQQEDDEVATSAGEESPEDEESTDEDEDNDEEDEQQATSDGSQQDDDDEEVSEQEEASEQEEVSEQDDGNEEEDEEDTPASSHEPDSPAPPPAKPRRIRKATVYVVTRYWSYNDERRSYEPQRGEEVVGVYGRAEQVAAKSRALRADTGEGCDDDDDDDGYDTGNDWEVNTGEETIGCSVESYAVDISEDEDEGGVERKGMDDEERRRELMRAWRTGHAVGVKEASRQQGGLPQHRRYA